MGVNIREEFEKVIIELGYVPVWDGDGYLYEEVQVAWQAWQAARESEGGEAVAPDTVYWHFEGSEQDRLETLHNDVQVVIGAGTLKGLLDGNAQHTSAPQPDKWMPCSERLPTEDDGFIWVYSTHTKAVLWRPQTWRDINMWTEREKCLWTPANLRKPTPPEQESE